MRRFLKGGGGGVHGEGGGQHTVNTPSPSTMGGPYPPETQRGPTWLAKWLMSCIVRYTLFVKKFSA